MTQAEINNEVTLLDYLNAAADQESRDFAQKFTEREMRVGKDRLTECHKLLKKWNMTISFGKQ